MSVTSCTQTENNGWIIDRGVQGVTKLWTQPCTLVPCTVNMTLTFVIVPAELTSSHRVTWKTKADRRNDQSQARMSWGRKLSMTHLGNCRHSCPAPASSESALRLTAESRMGSRLSRSPLWWLKSADLQERCWFIKVSCSAAFRAFPSAHTRWFSDSLQGKIC